MAILTIGETLESAPFVVFQEFFLSAGFDPINHDVSARYVGNVAVVWVDGHRVCARVCTIDDRRTSLTSRLGHSDDSFDLQLINDLSVVNFIMTRWILHNDIWDSI